MIGNVISVVQEIVEGLGQNIPYSSYQIVGTRYRFFVKKTLWLKVGDTINELGVNAYPIAGLLCDTWIEVEIPNPLLRPDPTGFLTTNPITFKSGTILRVSAELTQISGGADDFCPLVYLVEPMTSNQINDRRSAIRENADLRLFILDQCNDQDLLTSAEYRTAVHNKTDGITRELIKAFERDGRIGKLPASRTWNHINVGEYNEKGTTKKLFAYFMSGTELKMSLPMMKRCLC